MNKVILMGRLVKDPELKYTPSNNAVVSFTIAVDRRFVKQGEERQADFINIVAWRTTAEFVAKWFTKGKLISLVGSIQTRTWEDNEGTKRYATEVVADEVYFAGDKDKTTTHTDGFTAIENAIKESNDNEFVFVEDADLPF